MAYRTLGRTGIKVSCIGLGGHYDGPNARQKQSAGIWRRREVVEECLRNGITLFNTDYDVERQSLGEVLKETKVERDRITLVSDVNDADRTASETYDTVMAETEQHLKYLQIDCVDILRFTTLSRRTPPERMEAAMRAFDALKRAGKARHFAVSQHDPDLLTEWLDKYDNIDIVYTPFNYFANRAENELIPSAKRKNVGFIVIKPFNKGTIFNPNLFRSRKGVAGEYTEGRTLESLKRDKGLSLAQANLKYILANEGVSVVIPGMETASEVRENVGAVDKAALGPAEKALLDAVVGRMQEVLPGRYRWLADWRRA